MGLRMDLVRRRLSTLALEAGPEAPAASCDTVPEAAEAATVCS